MVVYFKDNAYIVKTLKEFQYIDEYGKDQGANGLFQTAFLFAILPLTLCR